MNIEDYLDHYIKGLIDGMKSVRESLYLNRDKTMTVDDIIASLDGSIDVIKKRYENGEFTEEK